MSVAMNSILMTCRLGMANKTLVPLAAPRLFLSTTSIQWNKEAKAAKEPLVLVSSKNGVTTMCMNNPSKLNGWTPEMSKSLNEAFDFCEKDPATKVAILTGAGPYYCAGVNLSSSIKPMHPKKLHTNIYEMNKKVFNVFIEFPKPIMVAANGPAIGACVTSATLCDALLASDKATFSTPFARLGIPPEGCSSVHFERIMGAKNAQRMLGTESWVPTAKEANEAGMVTEVVEHDKLMERAQALGEQWIKEGKKRGINKEEYMAVNDKESMELATAFLSYKFLDAQYRFLKSKNKNDMARIFWLLSRLRPLWGRLL